jgi:predicted PurR-regulated permease PerM
MSNFLERLREKPEKVRRRIVITATVLLTAIIVIIWITFLYAGFLKSEKPAKQSTSSPVSILLDEASKRFSDIKQGFDTTKESIVGELNSLSTELSSTTDESVNISSTTENEGSL